ncbi:ARM repeat superfamily protein [Actinidia rufa]|uniref:ARM repeat superfamily protein n=1 Tax=Actinidia rufa TaxID=165716 RepID=A0A7J0FHP1_9ERIC|nr:ARM repeat superfamily protein [Actinidia rufa]
MSQWIWTMSRRDLGGGGHSQCLTVELASSLVEGASEDLIASIFAFVKHTLQENDEVGQKEAYHTLSRILERSLDEENSKAFLVLNVIILTIKDSTEEARRAAYDMLLGINSSLQISSSVTSDEPYQKLITMVCASLTL